MNLVTSIPEMKNKTSYYRWAAFSVICAAHIVWRSFVKYLWCILTMFFIS